MMNKAKNGKYIEGGDERWYKDDKLHREEIDSKTGLSLAAVIYKDGTMCWYKEGKLHREEIDSKTGLSLAAVIYKDGTMCWYKNGKKHREEIDSKTDLSLPAEIWGDGIMQWYKEGHLHRIDGPACIKKGYRFYFTEKWYLNGVEVPKESHPWWMAQKDKNAIEEIIKKEKKFKSVSKIVGESVEKSALQLNKRKALRI